MMEKTPSLWLTASTYDSTYRTPTSCKIYGAPDVTLLWTQTGFLFHRRCEIPPIHQVFNNSKPQSTLSRSSPKMHQDDKSCYYRREKKESIARVAGHLIHQSCDIKSQKLFRKWGTHWFNESRRYGIRSDTHIFCRGPLRKSGKGIET